MKNIALLLVIAFGNWGGVLFASNSGDTITTPKPIANTKADAAFTAQNYREAYNAYFKTYQANATNPNNAFKLALAYCYLYHQPRKTITLLKAATANSTASYNFYKSTQTQASDDALYFLGKAYLAAEKIDTALQYFVEYQNKLRDNLPLDAGRQMKMCLNAKSLMKQPRELNVVNMGEILNSAFDEGNPIISIDNQTLLFSSRRPESNSGEEGILSDNDIYISKATAEDQWQKPAPFAFNTSEDEEPVFLSIDGNRLYLRRASKKGSGDIYLSEKQGDAFTAPVKLKGINSSADEKAIAISKDGMWMIISSNREGGMGGYDLYISHNKNGKWTSPKNMGANINTEMDEVSPHIFPTDKRIYYSTNGNTEYGMGGFDVLFTEMDSSAKKWSKPFTMGYPLNRAGNELHYITAANGRSFYSALNKQGNFDLWEIKVGEFQPEIEELLADVVVGTKETQTVEILEVDKEVKVEVEKEVEVTKIEEVEKEVEKNVGYVDAAAAKDLDKVVAIEKEEVTVETIVETEKLVYTNKSQKEVDSLNKIAVTTAVAVPEATPALTENVAIAVPDVNNSATPAVSAIASTQAANTQLEAAGMNKKERDEIIRKVKEDLLVEMNQNRSTVYKTFFFQFNSDELALTNSELEILASFMKEHKNVNIEVVGHTDNTGAWETNFWISRQRAKSVFDYLVSKGVSSSRIIFNGKGAIQPIASNSTGTGRAQNRRVEIILIQ
jgi:outer membrane protein OmpA-like peptidoglycan-associated protein